MAETVHSPIVTFASMLSLLALCPPFFHSSGFLWENGVKGLINIWPRPTAIAWKIIFCYGAFEAALQLLLPGKRVEGPVSPTGNRPVYKDNGMAAYFVTLATYLGLWWVMLHLHQVILVHVGMELYPRIGKNFDIKVFTNCRFGMMSWAVLAVTYCIKQYEINGRVSDSMLVNTILMLVYVTKFFGWEAGYWNSMDIAHDRAGFYICWGCLVGLQLAIYILVAGILCIYINYDCDRQRQEFKRTNGKCSIVATYKTTASETKTSLLLTSGCSKPELIDMFGTGDASTEPVTSRWLLRRLSLFHGS
ncbi:unnamed protein product [Brassica napus]|uniref:7-dehydrocholesterol reductase n=1 Tax=Brassica napus TaxID=3708 RepID=A0A816LCT4_BRANA|nr:unnamed protein product [Brassica napus]